MSSLVECESVGSSLVTRRSSRVSPISSTMPSKAQKGQANRVDEYRVVERQVLPPRSQKKPGTNQQRRLSLDDDVREVFPQQAFKSKHPTVLASDVEVLPDSGQAGQFSGNRILQNVETGQLEHMGQKAPTRSSQNEMESISVEARRPTSDTRESPDELQGEATVGPIPRLLGAGRKAEYRSPKTSHKLATNLESVSPNDFPERPERRKRRSKDAGPVKGSSHDRLFDANFFRFGTVERVPSKGKPVVIFMNDYTIGTVETDNQSENTSKISLKKVREVLRGMDNSCKVRLQLSSSEGPSRNVDMELSSTEDKDELCHRLSMLDVKVQERRRYVCLFSNEWCIVGIFRH